MTDDSERTLVGTLGHALSLAVDLRDAAGGGRPLGSPSVSLADRPESFTRTPSGYHVLSDLPADVDTVALVVDGGDAHLDEHQTVDLADRDRSSPKTVELLPSPAYPFGAGATVLRGMVADASGSPVADATVTVVDRDETARTTSAGEYALWLRDVDADDVTDDGELEVGGQRPVVEAARPDTDATTSAPTEVRVGETTRLDLDF